MLPRPGCTSQKLTEGPAAVFDADTLPTRLGPDPLGALRPRASPGPQPTAGISQTRDGRGGNGGSDGARRGGSAEGRELLEQGHQCRKQKQKEPALALLIKGLGGLESGRPKLGPAFEWLCQS